MWEPSETLVDSLEQAGIDKDLLNDLLSNVFIDTTHKNQLTIDREFAKLAATAHVQWTQSFNDLSNIDDFLHFLQLELYIDKHWRPNESTVSLLVETLGCDPVTVALHRRLFIQEFEGQRIRAWDSFFITYVLEQQEYTPPPLKTSQPEKTNEELGTPTLDPKQLVINKLRIDNIIQGLLKESYISTHFNYATRNNWQPAKWVVSKLLKMNIGKKHIYDDQLLKPFRSWYAKHNQISSNVDLIYLQYSIEKFKTKHKLLTKEKERLENEIKAGH